MNFHFKTLALPVVAAALAAPAAWAQSKVAIINVQQAIVATKDGEKAIGEIRQKFEGRAKDLESRTAEINKKRDLYNKGANTMAADAREKLQREIDDLTKKFQWDNEDLQNDVQQEEQKVINSIGQRMMQIIDGHAKDGGFSLVLDVSSQQSPVLWAANGIDITQSIVEQYDKKFGVGSGAGAAGAAKPAVPGAKPVTPAAKPGVNLPPPAARKPGAIK